MILHRGDIIHLTFWCAADEDPRKIFAEYKKLFDAYGIIIGSDNSLKSGNSFPPQVWVMRNESRPKP